MYRWKYIQNKNESLLWLEARLYKTFRIFMASCKQLANCANQSWLLNKISCHTAVAGPARGTGLPYYTATLMLWSPSTHGSACVPSTWS